MCPSLPQFSCPEDKETATRRGRSGELLSMRDFLVRSPAPPLPDKFRPARAGNYGKHPEIHERGIDDSNKRGQLY
jgi:hypothetical protein